VKAKSVSEIVGHQNLARLADQADYNAATLAELCRVSPRTLQRYFRENFQTSPQRCLEALRDIRARVLVDEGMRKKEVADHLGYKHLSHLSRRLGRNKQYSMPDANADPSPESRVAQG
jgi:transcriptional regulator GlxA family with amidase domain